MSATLTPTHKAIGAEVRRGTYDVEVDGKRVGSLEMNHTIETPVEPGRHTLQFRDGRNLSRTQTFDAAEGEVVAFRCTGKRTAAPARGAHPQPRCRKRAYRRSPAAFCAVPEICVSEIPVETGLSWSGPLLPVPSWPSVLRPQAQSLPVWSMA